MHAPVNTRKLLGLMTLLMMGFPTDASVAADFPRQIDLTVKVALWENGRNQQVCVETDRIRYLRGRLYLAMTALKCPESSITKPGTEGTVYKHMGSLRETVTCVQRAGEQQSVCDNGESFEAIPTGTTITEKVTRAMTATYEGKTLSLRGNTRYVGGPDGGPAYDYTSNEALDLTFVRDTCRVGHLNYGRDGKVENSGAHRSMVEAISCTVTP